MRHLPLQEGSPGQGSRPTIFCSFILVSIFSPPLAPGLNSAQVTCVHTCSGQLLGLARALKEELDDCPSTLRPGPVVASLNSAGQSLWVLPCYSSSPIAWSSSMRS